MFDGSICWQYAIKRQHEQEGADQFGTIDPANTEVKQIGLAVARSFVERFEWLGNIGSAQICYALIFREQILSVSCYTRATAPGGFTALFPEASAGCIYQLCRGATAPHAPRWAGSRVVGRSLKLLHIRTGARFVVAYADPRAGEVGVIYQSANAVYLGLTDARGPGEYVINGEQLHPRSVYRRYGTARDATLRLVDPNYRRVQRIKKHRYMFVLGNGASKSKALAAIAHLRMPAPRRLNQLWY